MCRNPPERPGWPPHNAAFHLKRPLAEGEGVRKGEGVLLLLFKGGGGWGVFYLEGFLVHQLCKKRSQEASQINVIHVPRVLCVVIGIFESQLSNLKFHSIFLWLLLKSKKRQKFTPNLSFVKIWTFMTNQSKRIALFVFLILENSTKP